jgi:unsaturated rhamnogalacturonyl hydrolase
MKTRPEFVTNFLRISLGAGLILAAGCSRLLNSEANAGKSEAFISNAGIRDVVARVAKHQIRPLANGDYPEVKSVEEAKAARPPEGISWSYPWGVALYGLIRSTDATGDRAADKFAVEHDQICARYYQWLAGLKKNVTNSAELSAFTRTNKIRGLMNLGNLDSCGAMGNQTLESLLRHPDLVTPAEKEVAARIADWIFNKQQRLPDGTLSRPTGGGTVWPDDLYMACPFIVRWAKFTGESKYLDDAANQIIRQAALEADTDGIWFHGYSVSEKKHSPFKWGRGNGWVTVATVEVLSALPENHPARARLIEILRQQIEGLKPLQTPDGLWRQVLDKPELWEETSCTAMFAYGIARAVNHGWIDPANMAMARKAFAGIAKNVMVDGAVNETCEGTNIGQTLDYYVRRGRPGDDPHGRGPVLLAGTEILLAKQ